MLDAYAVNTYTATLPFVGTATFTDTMSDITALNNGDVLVRNIMTKSQFPGYVTTIQSLGKTGCFSRIRIWSGGHCRVRSVLSH
jgi:hypothetical protein